MLVIKKRYQKKERLVTISQPRGEKMGNIIHGDVFLPKAFCELKDAKFVAIPFGHYSDVFGTRNAAARIIKASRRVEVFDEGCMSAGDPLRKVSGNDLRKELDRGDILSQRGVATLDLPPSILNNLVIRRNLDEAKEQFQEMVENEVRANRIPIILGGDHAVTPIAIKAVKKVFDKISILHFDSRLDLLDKDMDDYAYHRSVMREIFPQVDFIVSVGFRGHVSKEEMRFLHKNSDKMQGISMGDLWPVWNLKNEIKRILYYLRGSNVYITFDVGFLDPRTFGISTETPEPGGMTFNEVKYIWRKVLPEINVIGADFVEFCPIHDEAYPDYLLAQLIAKFASRLRIESEGE